MVNNNHFARADSATAQLPNAPFERTFSRFGSLFFAKPVEAFVNRRNLGSVIKSE
ncbi:hypothetical protein CP97_14565 [Aurantiacibacter atlanticus]|uniref:Uncharacterized protein n=1 Tax=Aurantiacibacter atlanticus TaxID=1648404 RepID=A0A0H4W0G2_9SPHN|nr:hypothetical protein CP97_14565 [Aurantiacibacter atlanticus]